MNSAVAEIRNKSGGFGLGPAIKEQTFSMSGSIWFGMVVAGPGLSFKYIVLFIVYAIMFGHVCLDMLSAMITELPLNYQKVRTGITIWLWVLWVKKGFPPPLRDSAKHIWGPSQSFKGRPRAGQSRKPATEVGCFPLHLPGCLQYAMHN